jgi:hypothetical protein
MNRRTIVGFRVTRHERAALAKIARTFNMPLSEWIRHRVFEGVTVHSADEDVRQPVLPFRQLHSWDYAPGAEVKRKPEEKPGIRKGRKGAPARS